MNRRSGLEFEVLVSDMVPAASPPLPDGNPSQWSPLSHTLIFGQREALLTDPPITRAQADAVADWLRRHDVALRYIYLTHTATPITGSPPATCSEASRKLPS
jgi:hypothetical protein